jgi:hypothetical protein
LWKDKSLCFKISNQCFKHKDNKDNFLKRSSCVKEDAPIFDDESNYMDDENDKFLFMAMNVENNYIDFERCMNEIAPKIGHNIKGTIVTTFHSREKKNHWIIDNGC